MEALERASVTSDAVEKENLAREAFNLLSKVPESADLRTVCKRFEDLRYSCFSWSSFFMQSMPIIFMPCGSRILL